MTLGRQFSSYRGVYLRGVTPDTPDEEILDRLAPTYRVETEPYGPNWTQDERTARLFALRAGTNMGYRKLPFDAARSGVLLEAVTDREPRLRSPVHLDQYGERQVVLPRHEVSGIRAHVVHKPDQAEIRALQRSGEITRTERHYGRTVRSFDIPEDHWR